MDHINFIQIIHSQLDENDLMQVQKVEQNIDPVKWFAPYTRAPRRGYRDNLRKPIIATDNREPISLTTESSTSRTLYLTQ